MTSPDPLAPFFTVPLTVTRKLGDGAAGAVYAPPDSSLRGRVVNERRLVRTADGAEVVSTARVSLPFGTPTILPESKVVLPDGRTALVLGEQSHDGPEFLPRYYSIDLT